MAGKAHPTHWLELYESHSNYEWAMQKAMAIVEPFGEDRADIRSAMNTLAPPATNENFDQVWRLLTNYTGSNDEPNGELEANAHALAKVRNQ